VGKLWGEAWRAHADFPNDALRACVYHKTARFALARLPPGAPRRQVVCLLGGTFGNLDHEVRFVRDSLCGFGPGTLLVLDYPQVFGPSEDEIRLALDPHLCRCGSHNRIIRAVKRAAKEMRA
jgi:hypothetical protein